MITGHAVRTGVAVIILCVASWLLYRSVGSLAVADIMAAIPGDPSVLMASALFTAVSFAALASYDVFAARIVAPGRVPLAWAALAGAAANAAANTLGFAAVTATAVRLRIYRVAGLGVGDIARITALSAATLVLGFAAMLSIALMLHQGAGGLGGLRLAGIALAIVLAALVTWLWRRPRRIVFRQFSLALPSGRLALIQMAIGAAEMAAAIGALYVLMPGSALPSFPIFASVYIGAVVLGIGSQSPGGLGVFEAAMSTVLGETARADVVAALLSYRLIYNVAPFILSALAVAWFELTHGPSSKVDSAG